MSWQRGGDFHAVAGGCRGRRLQSALGPCHRRIHSSANVVSLAPHSLSLSALTPPSSPPLPVFCFFLHFQASLCVLHEKIQASACRPLGRADAVRGGGGFKAHVRLSPLSLPLGALTLPQAYRAGTRSCLSSMNFALLTRVRPTLTGA